MKPHTIFKKLLLWKKVTSLLLLNDLMVLLMLLKMTSQIAYFFLKFN